MKKKFKERSSKQKIQKNRNSSGQITSKRDVLGQPQVAMPVILTMKDPRRQRSDGSLPQKYPKHTHTHTHTQREGRVAQIVKHPLTKYEVLSSNPDTIKKKKKEK
jgi:hypothetical protein